MNIWQHCMYTIYMLLIRPNTNISYEFCCDIYTFNQPVVNFLFLLKMDSKWLIQTEIKQEEPVEYYLVSSTSDGVLNVGFDAHSNDEQLAVITFEVNQ